MASSLRPSWIIPALLAALAYLLYPLPGPALSVEDIPTIMPRSMTDPPVKLEAVKLEGAPEVDGRGLEWEEVPEAVAPLWPTVRRDPDNHLGPVDLRIKAGVYEETLYLMLRWPDPLPNATHLSWVWDFTKNRYRPGSDLEDRLALRFALDENFSPCPLDGSPHGADLWLWRAARNNPVGYALDAFQLVSAEPLDDGQPWRLPDGMVRWLALRPDDAGSFTYTVSYDRYRGDIVPRFIVKKAEKLSGLQKRLVAKGIWLDGFWTLEMARGLDPEGPDNNVVFSPGSVVKMAASATNHGEGAHESVSPLIKLVLPPAGEKQTAQR